jgi:hypothetical protein
MGCMKFQPRRSQGPLIWVSLFLSLGFAVGPAALAQFDGPASTGVSASLIRLFGTNQAFTAQAEVQVLGPDNKERVGTPMHFTLTGGKIRVEVDMNRMRNREQPNAVAQVKPLGLDQVVSIIRPDQRTTLVAFPKLRSFVKLELPKNEAEAFLKRAKIERTIIGKEKMEGYQCVKQRVVITDDSGQKSEATVWIAPELRDFPVCVATREKQGTVVIRFRKVQFGRTDPSRFDPPAGFTECADMQMLMAGPVVKYMQENKTAVKVAPAPKASSPARAPKAAPVAPKKK